MGLSYAFGPRGSALAWVPSPGQWVEVGFNTLVDANSGAPTPNSGNSFAQANSFLDVWNGGAYDPFTGTFGRILYGPCGGHDTYDGNDVYEYDIETRLCSRVNDTATATNNRETSGSANTFGEYDDGSPIPNHDHAEHVVIEVGGVPTLLVPEASTWTGENGAGSAYGHSLNLNALTWTRGPQFSAAQYHGMFIADRGRNCAWGKGQATPGFVRIDGDLTLTTYATNNYAIADGAQAFHDTRRDRFVHFLHTFDYYIVDLQNPGTKPSSTSGGAPGSMDYGSYMGYSQDLDIGIAWNGGKTVYTIDAGNLAGGWTAQGAGSTLTPPGGSSAGSGKQAYSKLYFFPQFGENGILLGITDKNEPAWAYGLEAP